jgi:hypothetical protein
MVHSPEFEVELRLFAAIKTRALMHLDGLPRLRIEEPILAEALAAPCQIQKELLRSSLAARQCAKDVLSGKDVQSFQAMKRNLSESAEDLLSMDRTFILELSFAESAFNDSLLDAIKSKILGILPTSTREESLPDASAALQLLANTDLVKWSSKPVTDKMDAIRETIAKMMRGYPPNADLFKDDKFYKPLLEQFPFFVKRGDKVGAAALELEFASMQEKMVANAKAVTLKELHTLQAFKFLLTPVQQGFLGKWSVEVIKHRTASAAEPSASSSSRASGQEKTADDPNTSRLASYFE